MENISNEMDMLFNEMEADFPSYNGKLIKDGIINNELFSKAKIKLLFITKEPNDPAQTSWSLSDWMNTEMKYSFAKRIAEWSYGILNDFPPISTFELTELHKSLKSIAIINIKKTGGKSNSDLDEIVSHLKQNKTYLLKQIRMIKPDLIIGGIGHVKYWSYLFDNIEFKDSGYDIKFADYNGIRILDYYHPSYRVPKAMSYALLKVVYEEWKNNRDI